MYGWLKTTVFALVLLGPAVALADQVTCESTDGKQKECDMNTRGDVRLVRQLSKSACTEGVSWGLNRHSVWVSNGCRGVFASDDRGGDSDGRSRGGDDYPRGGGHGGGRDDDHDRGRGRDDDGRGRGRDDGGDRRGRDDDSDNLPREVTCESNDKRQVECPMNTRGEVRVIRQLSKTACVEGVSWGLSRHSVWVKDGCRAVFGLR
jgi:hypothetical protein